MKVKMHLAFVMGMMLVLASCGKYEDGPFFSIRTKNARLEGNWKMIKQDRKSVSSFSTSTYTLANDVMTENVDGIVMTYSYSESWEISVKDNHITISTLEDGFSEAYTTYWNWENGSSSKELINVDGDLYRVLKLTNKEMVLENNHSSSSGSAITDVLTFEKQ